MVVLPAAQLEEKLPVTKENLCVPMFAVTPVPVVLAVLGLLTVPGILAVLEALDFFEYLLYLDKCTSLSDTVLVILALLCVDIK